ncbi:redox-sensing transcriptional repressor Rex [Candidatus Bipolaricaulota bacterium]|nr:redox-sensing transcriptional repressor Rex [Candidatus Bipolaricaulota bacterium]MBS3814170.1 redox-sensing transcriptional repressor Rex [Candidatus Bipolaricaulota bacterium]MBS3825315.1 redox-sensing transcriptional repressor Rex [Candidatus Bipolaricaulota bacterium]
MKERKIPKETIDRLPLYLRCLEKLIEDGEKNISSKKFSDKLNLNSAQVRKDLSYFGDFGTRGVGYSTQNLATKIREILNLDQKWKMALAGVGNIGSALLTYTGFDERVFEISMAFDQNPQLIGEEINGVKVEDVSRMEERIGEEDVKLGIIAVPASSAQEVADKMGKGGVKGVLNFAPTLLDMPEEVELAQVDITRELEQLVYYL